MGRGFRPSVRVAVLGPMPAKGSPIRQAQAWMHRQTNWRTASV